MLTAEGHVSEGSAENLFMVRNGELVTPGVEDDILEGVTRSAMMQLAKQELGLKTHVRSIDRSELYVAEEVLLCGTGAQISPVTSIDHRPVGTGNVGPITARADRALLRCGARPPARLHGLADPDLLGVAWARGSGPLDGVVERAGPAPGRASRDRYAWGGSRRAPAGSPRLGRHRVHGRVWLNCTEYVR